MSKQVRQRRAFAPGAGARSKAAGESAEEFTGRQRVAVYEAIVAAGHEGLTLEEMCARVDFGKDSGKRTRCAELVDLGQVKWNGQERLSTSRRLCKVWVAT